MIARRPPLGHLLQQHGIISDMQLMTALEYQRGQGGRLGEALIALGLCSETDIARVLAEQMEIPFVDLRQSPPTAEALALVPLHVARAHTAVPVRLDGRRLLVAARNPFDIRIDEAMRKASGLAVVVAASVEEQIAEVLGRYEELKASVPPSDTGTSPAEPGLIPAGERAEIVQLVDSLIAEGVRRDAASVHLEPAEEGYLQIRCRLDGAMVPFRRIPAPLAGAVVTRIRTLCGLGAVGQEEVRHGTARVRVDGRSIELRATSLPAAAGELVIIRLVDPERPLRRVETLGFEEPALRTLRGILAGRQGLVLVTGPADSGKTTTLRALVREMTGQSLHVVAVDEESDGILPGVHQLRVRPESSVTTTILIQTALMQEPDVLVVSRLDDADTANRACQAAAQGRLVLSTLAAQGALDAIDRLLDLGVTPSRLATSLCAVVSQRLVPRVCERCAGPQEASPALTTALQQRGISAGAARVRQGTGCEQCWRRGTRGRQLVYEVLLLDEDLRFLIAERKPPSQIHEHVRRRGCGSMAQQVLAGVAAGLFPPEEAHRGAAPLAGTAA